MKTKYVNYILCCLFISLGACTQPNQVSLPRSTPAKENVDEDAITRFLTAVKDSNLDLHSLMIVRHGKVIFEQWLGDNTADQPHVLNSVSKTFTATAIGFAVAEGKLKLSDKLISFFPDKLPPEVSDHLRAVEIRHLLTMSCGQDIAPNNVRFTQGVDWVEGFLAAPFVHKPGTFFVYNSMGSYMLSAIIEKVTGEKLVDYLTSRLFVPLEITGATWEESPQGINTGGWGLYLKTEDLAKMGQFFLQKGKWNGKRLLPQKWFDEATAKHINSLPAGRRPEQIAEIKEADCLQGYGYQMWRSRHNSYRADGNLGQFILILPEKDAVIVTTSDSRDMYGELNMIWDYLLPAFK